MKIVLTFSDGTSEWNSSNWRTLMPARALIKAGHDIRILHLSQWMDHTQTAIQACTDADLIVIQRVMAEDSVARAEYWHSKKRAIVVDFDDAYQLIDDTNAAHVFWGKGQVEIGMPYGVKFDKPLTEHPLQQFIRATRSFCVGGTMPSRILQKDWNQHFPCWYVPNYVDADRYIQALAFPKPKSKWITLGYGGSLSHVPSFKLSGVADALGDIIKLRPNVRILLCGDRRLYDLIPAPAYRKEFLNYVPWYDWPKILRKFDVYLAPMAGRYDHSRSAIKVVEAGLMQIPFIASECDPYQEWQNAGFGTFVPSGDDLEGKPDRIAKWKAALLDTIDNLSDHKQAILPAQEFTREIYDVERNVGRLVSTFEEIINRGVLDMRS